MDLLADISSVLHCRHAMPHLHAEPCRMPFPSTQTLKPNPFTPCSALKQAYDEKLLDLQRQRDELQRERLELQKKLDALQHASG